MDQNNGTEAKISKEETRTLITITLGEIPLLRTRISLQDQMLHMGTVIQITEDNMTNAQLSHSVEAMGTDLEINFLTIGMETYLVLHRLQGQTSYKRIPIANQEVISLKTLLSADLTLALLLV